MPPNPIRRLRPLRVPTEAWLWERIDAQGDCWLWSGHIKPSGYGSIDLGPRQVQAHRHVFEVLVGPIGLGLELDHLCRVKHCVNPDHLEPVDHATNCRRGVAGAVNGARYRALSHCKRGHPFDEANTYRHPQTGRRACRRCHAAHELAAYHRAKAVAA